MAKKTRPILTPRDLARFIRQAPEKQVRACLISIAEARLLDMDPTHEFLNPLKSIDGGDFVEMVAEHLQAYGFWPSSVTCSICHNETPAATAHLHEDRWIGECCWDERLKASE